MRNIIVCSSHRGIAIETQASITACISRGWAAQTDQGCADVALARNMALSRVCEKTPHDPSYVVLMVDDDIEFDPHQAEQLCAQARRLQEPVSAVYATRRGTLAAALMGMRGSVRLYLTGLGFLAIPAPCLQDLFLRSHSFQHDRAQYRELCWTGKALDHWDLPVGLRGCWLSEDFCLTFRMGGARLSAVGVGHLKSVPIYPDRKTQEHHAEQIPLVDPEDQSPDTQRGGGEASGDDEGAVLEPSS